MVDEPVKSLVLFLPLTFLTLRRQTLQTIAFLAHLKSKHQYGPYLVVCPASVLRNWIDEVERFAPQMRALAYYSSDKKQRKRWIDEHRREPKTPQERLEFPIFVTTYEIAINDSKLLGSMRWKFIVVDEGHRLKNRNARYVQLESQEELRSVGTSIAYYAVRLSELGLHVSLRATIVLTDSY